MVFRVISVFVASFFSVGKEHDEEVEGDDLKPSRVTQVVTTFGPLGIQQPNEDDIDQPGNNPYDAGVCRYTQKHEYGIENVGDEIGESVFGAANAALDEKGRFHMPRLSNMGG